MDIKWLHSFIIAAKYENFRQASEMLFVSQPTITLHIKHLEEILGVALFERSGRNVILTEAGQRFLAHAQKVLDSYTEGLEDLEGWKQGYDRKLTVAVAPHIAVSILPLFLREFLDAYPSVEIIINVMKSTEIGEKVSAGQADLGLSRMVPPQVHLSCESIFEDPVVLLAPAEQNGDQQLNEDRVLSHYRLFTHNHPVYWDEILPNLKRLYPKIRTMVVNHVDITKRFIEAGLGISFLPYSIVQHEIAQGTITLIEAKQINLPTSHTYIVYQRETAEIEQFRLLLRQFMSSTPNVE